MTTSDTFPFAVSGIPCLIRIVDYDYCPPFRGPAHLCDSDYDYYGWEETSYEVLDRRGRKADWLSRKVSDGDDEAIQAEIFRLKALDRELAREACYDY